MCQVASDTCQVASDTCQVASDTCQVASDMCQVASDTYQMATDMYQGLMFFGIAFVFPNFNRCRFQNPCLVIFVV